MHDQIPDSEECELLLINHELLLYLVFIKQVIEGALEKTRLVNLVFAIPLQELKTEIYIRLFL